jgi:hypothetical protein
VLITTAKGGRQDTDKLDTDVLLVRVRRFSGKTKKKKKIIIFTPNYGPRIRVFWIAMLTPVGSPQPRKRIPADCIPHREQARDADHHGPVQKVSCTVEGEFVS